MTCRIIGASVIFYFSFNIKKNKIRLPWWLSGKESACQYQRPEFDPWAGKIPHTMEQLSLHAVTIEPVLWSLGTATTEAHAPWSPCSTAREVRASQLESSPCSPQLEESSGGVKTQHSQEEIIKIVLKRKIFTVSKNSALNAIWKLVVMLYVTPL